MIETLSKLGIEENFFNVITFIYKKTTVNIFSGEMLCAFSLSSGTAQVLLFLFYHSFYYFTNRYQLVQQNKKKRIKWCKYWKGACKTVIPGDIIVNNSETQKNIYTIRVNK